MQDAPPRVVDAPRHSKRSAYDWAYACFLLCGLTALITSVVSVVPMDTGTAGGVGFFVLIPLSLASLGAILIGLVLTVRLWGDPGLIFLSLASLLLCAEIATEFGSRALYDMAPVVYGAVVIVVCSAWFLILRRKRFPND